MIAEPAAPPPASSPAALPAQPVNYPPILLPEGSFTLVPISDLLNRRHPNNNNKHPKAQLKAYIPVLSAGVRVAVIVSRQSGRIVKGHGALDAAILKGWTHWPVQYQDFTNEDDELAFLLADNHLQTLSKADEMSTAGILARLQASTSPGFNLAQTGYGKGKIKSILESLQEEPKPKAAKPLSIPLNPAWEAAAAVAGLPVKEWAEKQLTLASVK